MNSLIIISPYSRPLRNGNRNAKNYPWWEECVELLKQASCEILQIGTGNEPIIKGVDSYEQNLPFLLLQQRLQLCTTWASVDNFFPHFIYNTCKKPGVVIWGKSSPSVFGYSSNLNLVKDPLRLRKDQFGTWENELFDSSIFVSSHSVVSAILSFC